MAGLLKKVNTNIQMILSTYKHVAVVGLSPNPYRPSNSVASYLAAAGYIIYPVNPGHDEILDRKSYKSLLDIPVPIEVVDIFRKSEDVLSIVQQAIKIGAKAVWMQSGIINEEAAQLALNAGLDVVMDACMKVEHAYLG